MITFESNYNFVCVWEGDREREGRNVEHYIYWIFDFNYFD